MCEPLEICVYCHQSAQGNYSIHETEEAMWNGGPEVPLCNGCGSTSTPTCPEIWAHIAETKEEAVNA